MAAPLGRDTLPDCWSYGVCSDGRVFFIKWADFCLPLHLSRRHFMVLLRFSNRCLSCSDQTRSTTWLHPRTGEPVNSGHMIRSGTPQTSPDLRSTPGLVPRCGCFRRFNAVSACFTDLPRGWEEGFTDEGASYFIKSVASQHCLTGLACCFSLVHHR